MIKAKKGLLIALFAAMMVFAFGATSAFAAQTNTWSDNFTKCTVSGVAEHNNYQYNAEVTFDPATGLLHAQVTKEANEDISWKDNLPQAEYWFYDLNGAVLYAGEYKLLGTYDNGQCPEMDDITGAKLLKPSYAKSYNASNPEYTTNPIEFSLLGATTFNNWTAEVTATPEYDKTAKEEQNFTVKAKGSYYSAYDGTKANPEVVNTIPEKAVKVLGRTADATDVNFFKDEVVKDNTKAIANGAVDCESYVKFVYDGAAHKIVNNEIDGVTVKWEVFNEKTGKWGEVNECPTVTNVADEALVKATTSWTVTEAVPEGTVTKTIKRTQEFYLWVDDTEAPTFGFDPDGDFEYNSGNYGYYADPTAGYNEWDFIVVTPYQENGPGSAVRARNAKRAAAVEANEAEWKAFVQDFDKIVKTTKKATPDMEYLELQRKTSDEIDADALKALKEKYKTLLENFGLEDESLYDLTRMFTSGATKAAVELIDPDTAVDEVLFTNAPDMTYHVKKAKKMKKTKSFTVAAVAASGKTVTYKIDSPSKKIKINAETGKITVKKGLKKGTYKVLLMAGTEKGAGYMADTAYRQLTIKVKK